MDARQRGAFYLRWSLSAPQLLPLLPLLQQLLPPSASMNTACPHSQQWHSLSHLLPRYHLPPRTATTAARHRRPASPHDQPGVLVMSGLMLADSIATVSPASAERPRTNRSNLFWSLLMILALVSLIRSQNPSNEFLKPCEDFLLLLPWLSFLGDVVMSSLSPSLCFRLTPIKITTFQVTFTFQ